MLNNDVRIIGQGVREKGLLFFFSVSVSNLPLILSGML